MLDERPRLLLLLLLLLLLVRIVRIVVVIVRVGEQSGSECVATQAGARLDHLDRRLHVLLVVVVVVFIVVAGLVVSVDHVETFFWYVVRFSTVVEAFRRRLDLRHFVLVVH